MRANCLTCGRSSSGTGAKSPTISVSMIAESSAALDPKMKYTVWCATPAFRAISVMVVAVYPRSRKSSLATAQMRCRVFSARSCRTLDVPMCLEYQLERTLVDGGARDGNEPVVGPAGADL